MKLPPPSEAETHCAVVQWLLAGNRRDLVFFHVPNEGRRGWQSQRWLKQSGVQAGIPDLVICHRGRTMFLEIKSAKGRLSEAQAIMAMRLGDAGFPVYVARSFDDATKIICEFIKAAA